MLENFRVAEDMPIESDIVVGALDKVNTHTNIRTHRRTYVLIHKYTYMYTRTYI